MDHYPEVNVSERECPSRLPSNSSSIQNSSTISHQQQDGNLAPPQYTSFPSPSTTASQDQNQNQQHRTRNDSAHGDCSTLPASGNMDAKNVMTQSLDLSKDLARYTDAPPPYSEKQYEGKSEAEQAQMRMMDYAKEISRMMGRQLAMGMRSGESKVITKN